MPRRVRPMHVRVDAAKSWMMVRWEALRAWYRYPEEAGAAFRRKNRYKDFSTMPLWKTSHSGIGATEGVLATCILFT